jgi:methionyl-tRNA formyltransferase
MNKSLKIIFFGSRDFVIPVIEKVKENFDLVGIVTVADQPAGRHQNLTPTPVKQYFLNSGIPIFDPEKLDSAATQQLKQTNADLFVVAAYGNMIPDQILNLPKFGALNLHPSLLPRHRGPSPLQNTLLNGEKETGMSFMLLDQKMDHGPILYQIPFSISDDETFESLGQKIFLQAAEKVVEVVDKYTNKQLMPLAQNDSQATFTKLIKKEDGFFDIENPPEPEKLDRMIRAFYPWPNAWTRWNDKIVKFLPRQMVQMEGKKAVSLKDFLNGYPDFPLKEI